MNNIPTKRKQCAKCPWRKDVDPHDIPNGYCVNKHAALKKTIAVSGYYNLAGVQLMACHESSVGQEVACAGWLNNQLGPGNNIGLRMLALRKRIDCEYELVGEQHKHFEDTLPKGAGEEEEEEEEEEDNYDY